MAEMLSPSIFQRKPPWRAKIFVTHLFDHEAEQTPAQLLVKGRQIATVLRNCGALFLAGDREEAEAIIQGFDEGAIDLDEFNGLLDRMYDVCDQQRIWVE